LHEFIEWKDALQNASERLSEALQNHGKDSVVVVASPQLTNEDLFLIRKFFGEDLGISQIDFRVPDRNSAAGDNFLLREDRNPNSRGAEVIFLNGNEFSFPLMLQSPPDRKLRLLYVFEQDIVKKLGEETAKSFLSRFEYVVYLGSNENETSLLADLVLPSATYAEVEGTFTNFEGRVQKIDRAVEPLGDSQPTWQIVAKLARTLGLACGYACSEEVFLDLADRVVEFENLNYEKIGYHGAQISEPSKVGA